MNLEQRQILLERINKLECLLAYAVKTGEMKEAGRLCGEIEPLLGVL